MTTVYTVSQGQYSDYGIVGIFSTLDKARAYRDEGNSLYGHDHFNQTIDEHELDAPLERAPVLVTMEYETGNFAQVSRWWGDEDKDAELWSNYDGNHSFCVALHSDTAEQAIKAANEIRTRAKALNWFDLSDEGPQTHRVE